MSMAPDRVAVPPVVPTEPEELEVYARYFLKVGIHDEREVTMEAFMEAEQLCGFRPKPYCGPLATSGFTFDNGSTMLVGRIMYQNEDGSWT